MATLTTPPEVEQAGSSTTMTYREALRLALREELEHDEKVFLIGEEIGVFEGSYKVTAGLFKEFGPKRCLLYTSPSPRDRS